jgi:thiol-disulfide isomerase/thioredoxin
MKIALSIFLLLSNLLAYKINDEISSSMAAHLNLNEDKIYVIDFFASWCGSCKKEIPLISQVNLKIDNTKVEIIGIDVDKKVTDGIKFQQRLKKEGKLNFRVINDPQNLIISEFNPKGMPTLYYVKNKKVIAIITGAVDKINSKILDDLKGME